MRYSIPALLVFLLVATLLTIAMLLGIQYVLDPALSRVAATEDLRRAIHAFFFERTPIQWCTLTAFFFVLMILVGRFSHHVSLLHGLESAPDRRSEDPRLNAVVKRRYSLVSTHLAEHGRRAAAMRAEELAERDEESLERLYSLLGSVIQIILALGFFGTVWGISRSMFGFFTGIGVEDSEQLNQSLGGFTQALSTALDTTILALICAILASVLVTAMRWAEAGGLQSLTDEVRHHYGLESAATEGESPAAAAIPVIEASRVPLMQLIKDTVAQFHSEMRRAADDHLAHVRKHHEDMAARSQVGLSRAAQETLKILEIQSSAALGDLTALAETMQRSITETQDRFRSQVELVIRRAQESDAVFQSNLIAELRRIEQSLHRVPEVSIRYPQDGTGGLGMAGTLEDNDRDYLDGGVS